MIVMYSVHNIYLFLGLLIFTVHILCCVCPPVSVLLSAHTCMILRLIDSSSSYNIPIIYNKHVTYQLYIPTGCLTTHDAVSNSLPVVTLPSEHVRGRYSLGMYLQMGHTDLIASTVDEYVTLSVKLLSNDSYQREQKMKIEHNYLTDLHKNKLVADEWLDFITLVVRTTG